MTSALHRQDTPLAHQDALVLDYLGELWAATDDLAPDLRDELMHAVAQYVARRRSADCDGVVRILTMLGPAEELAAAARRGRTPAHLIAPAVAPAPTSGVAGPVEWTGVTLITAGSVVLPVVGPLAGILLVSSSDRWSPVQKAAAWLLAGAPTALGVLIVLFAMVTGRDALSVAAYLAMVAGPMSAGLTLMPGLFARRTAARHP
jgi:hypothetical protein